MPDVHALGWCPTRRRLALALALAALVADGFSPMARARAERTSSARSGVPLDVSAFRAAGDRPKPAVLILGGSKGYASASYGLLAAALNGAGLDAFLVSYLTPDDKADLAQAGSAHARIALYAGRLAAWSDAVRNAIEELGRGPAPPTAFGVIGISLGAMPALAASMDGASVRALAIVDGSLPDGALTRVHTLPPLLTVWGAADRVFPISVGAKLDSLAQRLGGSPKSVIYGGRGHAFFVDPDDADAARARTAVTAFLAAHL